jgi:hypothetical protein
VPAADLGATIAEWHSRAGDGLTNDVCRRRTTRGAALVTAATRASECIRLPAGSTQWAAGSRGQKSLWGTRGLAAAPMHGASTFVPSRVTVS